MSEPNIVGGLIGGGPIGLTAALLLLINGRIAGVSAILGGLIASTASGSANALMFVAAMVLGQWLAARFQKR